MHYLTGLLALFPLLISGSALGQPKLSYTEQTQILNTVGDLLKKNYVFPERLGGFDSLIRMAGREGEDGK